MAHKPFSGKVTLVQWKHSIPSMPQDALDESPRGLTDWRIKALLRGKISQVQPAVWADKKKKIKAIDPYFVIDYVDTDLEEWNVHCEINPKIKVGYVSKEGGYVGDIAQKNPSGAAPHRHHFFRSKKTKKPMDVLSVYIKYGIYPNDWILDPLKLIPKGKYVMSKPKVEAPKPQTPSKPPKTNDTDPKDILLLNYEKEIERLTGIVKSESEKAVGYIQQIKDLDRSSKEKTQKIVELSKDVRDMKLELVKYKRFEIIVDFLVGLTDSIKKMLGIK